MSLLVLNLLLAHILGDFVLQPNHWVKQRTQYKRIKYLFYHMGVHAVLTFALMALVVPIERYWGGAVVIIVSHFFIDWAKQAVTGKMNPIAAFLVDQLLHLLIIFGVANYYGHFYPVQLGILSIPQVVLFILFVLLVTKVGAIFIKVFLSQWRIEDIGVNNAGQIIGMIERLFVFGFICIDFWSGIGFLLAAKSVFRFGDLNNAKDRNLTEYVLVGTLLSFGWAILMAVLYTKMR
jgi:hypothetical protein